MVVRNNVNYINAINRWLGEEEEIERDGGLIWVWRRTVKNVRK